MIQAPGGVILFLSCACINNLALHNVVMNDNSDLKRKKKFPLKLYGLSSWSLKGPWLCAQSVRLYVCGCTNRRL